MFSFRSHSGDYPGLFRGTFRLSHRSLRLNLRFKDDAEILSLGAAAGKNERQLSVRRGVLGRHVLTFKFRNDGGR